MIGESWVTDCPGDAFTLTWYECNVTATGLDGILYMALGSSYIELELEKVALLPSAGGFFDELQEHEIYVSHSGSYVRLKLDV